ncbi:S1 family peptidase [Cognatiluteimonas weifangensis]|uniref:Serine protease n=1 Tax=Cognatiluteimonas weifangensis TaxID=2303539 RepID=A0A372DS83_9GAMM|nr:serine protease [Luteimonas weifangensis]RFP62438.1 serine protease [Luteimonas weifangensis]
MQDSTPGARAGRTPWLALIAGLCFAAAAPAASLDPQRLPGIQAATFEVVSAKPLQDPLQYERPLPLELLPFQQRNDKYYSIGTAFAIGDGRYVTAAHVLLTGVDSLWGPPALRDNGGRVYAIDKVRKFSLEKDFVVFTLAAPPAVAALPLETVPVPGQAVYSVGNAYGTGVVIRDGLYTSDTPEQQDGRWNWLRFSAAASPGNSGGPLVDKDGKVLGVVLAKSPNENLNYALPIAQVLDAPDDLARIDQRVSYQFDVFDSTISNTFRTQFALPLALDDFYAAYSARVDAYVDSQLRELLGKEPQRLFPNGEGSSELLHSIATMGDFPRLITRNSSGTWGLSGEAENDVRLAANGYVTPGAFGKNLLFHLRKPDDVPADRLYREPAVAMDLLLKTGFLKRNVGAENILVTSLGAPAKAAVHVDAWGRRWQEWRWPLPYANAWLVVLALPVPDGYVGVARFALAMQEHDQLINTRALTDFVYVNYDGTLAQWKEFLRRPELLPAALRDTRIDFDYGRRFSYASGRMRFAFTPQLQAIQPDSVLTLGFAFFPDRGKVVWDAAEVWLSAKASDDNYLMLVRGQAPPPHLGDDYRNDWEKKLRRQHPFDAKVRSDEDATKITTVVAMPGADDPAVLYTAYYTAEGSQPQAQMQDKLELLLQDLHVLER